MSKLRFYVLLAFLTSPLSTLRADPISYLYDGDKTPAKVPYGPWFTTLGPGHPTGQYFPGTTWGSDSNVLTMTTQHPNDFPGATSQGIWFGIGHNYNDSPGIALASTADGNRVEARLALGLNSSEWSLYWYDSSAYGAAFYFLSNGFHVYTPGNDIFVPVATMTNFHTYVSHIHNGRVFYYFDGDLIATGAANGGPGNFLLLGDGSAGGVSGFGTLRVDFLNIIVNAGPPSPPQPNPILLANPMTATNGSFQFAFTNIPGLQFGVQMSTNLEAGSWTVAGSATEISPGQFQFTDSQPATNQQSFYRVLAQ